MSIVNSTTADLDILCEDGPLIAVNKPAGLLTQGVPQGHPTLEGRVKAYLKQKYAKPGNVYLGVPHRLDRPVSGIVVFAKNSKAAARLAEQFRERSVQKVYLAVTERTPDPPSGRLTDWLLKDAAAAHVTVVEPDTAGAKEAILDYRVLAEHGGRALVEIELHTGRMHQIRVQLASRGWNIVGDLQYGAALTPDELATHDRLASPIALHAWRLSLFHPIRYDRLSLEAPVPPSWSRFGLAIEPDSE
jgi:23S rRNA pseudouridine1911/1915/1917 synthase